MKTKEELGALKNDVENVNEKLHELTPEELEQVTGGGASAVSLSQFASVAGEKLGDADAGFQNVR